ncbi:MAG: 50S ribosomal protein L25 [Candidatus Marinimicrobia bacterium]|jgi:large subunit ribosomal protein L25|nr:50S ribosomal protein L25 [Candidatus Neomarinimicrobiota bacterium]MBT3576846.1 50S ribosomal protein L25 [Candidatus Neomarinimicrobiota bacterium]MBT3679054.1 50S ribosomal protein L25 [Candidatus Neomarinimicrobiota bacterium]MBT3950311.1 50S ribosomal protein L25 [Candidatus Neomarinimicrobiota bacterium]MBT4252075.1 50S ribosomal protein L25 [Candidatus Neomarinimicrobiota bacterium]
MAQAKKTKERFELQIEQRSEFGRKAAKALRRNGFVPVNFYSGGEEAQSYVMTETHLRDAMHSGEQIFNITIDGEQRRAMVKDVQWHPVTDKILHMDFFGVRLRDIIEIPVAIIANGLAIGVQEGGVLQQPIHEVVVRCKGEDVPDSIEVDVSELNIGDGIHASDIQSDVYEVLLAEDITIISVVIPQKMEEPVVEVDEDDLEFEDEEGSESEDGEKKEAEADSEEK